MPMAMHILQNSAPWGAVVQTKVRNGALFKKKGTTMAPLGALFHT